VSAALVAACKGEPPRETAAPPASPTIAVKSTAPPTYWNRVATILETHCTSCHAPGGIGPMALTTFADANTNAGPVAHEMEARHMPPWLPATRACASLKHERSVPQEDIDAVIAWAKAGAPEGVRADYRAPEKKGTYARLPDQPDRVAIPDAPYTPKRGKVDGKSDDYHCFVLDPKLEKKERIVGLRIAPGAAAIVHHVLLFEVRASAIDRIKERDDAEPGPGYTCFGGIGVQPTVRAGNLAKGELVDFDAQMIVGWAPGGGGTDVAGAPTALPKDTAIHLAPGSRLVMQVHYSMDNMQQGMSDRTRVDMWTAKDGESKKQGVWVPLLKYDFHVPPGAGPDDPRARASAEATLPLPLEILGVAPHMHLRGRTIKVEAVRDDELSQCLLDVPAWDFRHQEAYWLGNGVRASKASLSCAWDNRPSAQPVAGGKRKAPRELHWGEGTDDEMCLAFLYATL
jgi:hypothetical protein